MYIFNVIYLLATLHLDGVQVRKFPRSHDVRGGVEQGNLVSID